MKKVKKETDKKKSTQVTNILLDTKNKKISGNLFSKKTNNLVVKSGQSISGKISKPK